MTATKIKLETFLLELIENAGAELKEEIEALEEGADIKTSGFVMRVMVDDLNKCAIQVDSSKCFINEPCLKKI